MILGLRACRTARRVRFCPDFGGEGVRWEVVYAYRFDDIQSDPHSSMETQ